IRELDSLLDCGYVADIVLCRRPEVTLEERRCERRWIALLALITGEMLLLELGELALVKCRLLENFRHQLKHGREIFPRSFNRHVGSRAAAAHIDARLESIEFVANLLPVVTCGAAHQQ